LNPYLWRQRDQYQGYTRYLWDYREVSTILLWR
jgi:hypothetical protein